MIPISSTLEGYESTFQAIRDQLESEDFVLGGGYKYDHGYFDKELDVEEHKTSRYYLRIPVYALDGNLDELETKLYLGKPFVIKHEFLTTNDPSGKSSLTTALVDQFSKPIPTDDADIDQKWVNRAKETLQTVEQKLLKH